MTRLGSLVPVFLLVAACAGTDSASSSTAEPPTIASTTTLVLQTTTSTPTTTVTLPTTTTTEAAPVIELAVPELFYTTTGQYEVSGFASRYADVVVAGVPAEQYVDDVGRVSFWANLDLEPGTHLIEIVATTQAGTRATVTLSVIVDPTLTQMFGYLTALDLGNGTVVVDPAEWLTGAEAMAAAKADGVIPQDQDFIDGDFYIRNPRSDTVTFALDQAPVVALQACWPDAGPCVVLESVDTATWQALLDDPASGYDVVGWHWYGDGYLPYWFTMDQDQVIQVAEHYLP